jgi:tetratricopeptide (TPR) repeat protein
VLVGREQHFAALRSGAERARKGAGGLFVLTGPAGIGKTRLADELAADAERMGLEVHWGRAWETGGAPPYWPWAQILTTLHEKDSKRPLPASLSPIVSRGERRAVADARVADPAEARFALSEAVVGFLRESAKRSPLALLLDDLHAADVPSLELLHFVARGLRSERIFITATWREDEARLAPGAELIARLAREASVFRLAPLGPDDVRALLAGAGRDADASLVKELFDRTEGNPLLLSEAMRLLESGGTLADLPAAPGISALVADAAARLPDDARTILPAASVLGREIATDVLADVVELPRPEVERRLDQLATGGILRRRADVWIFRHVLIRDALYEELPIAERRAIHARAARVLERKIEAGQESELAPCVHHALSALPELDPKHAAPLVLRAAARARSQRAYEEATALLERARATFTPWCDDGALQAELTLALGWASLEAGRAERAREAFRATTALARKLDDARLLARAAFGHGAEYALGESREELIQVLREALAKLDPSEVALRARLTARLAAALIPGPNPASSLAMAREAIEAMKDSADDRAVLEVALSAGSALADFADPSDRIPVNEELVHRARRLGDRVVELRALSRLVTDFMEAGDVPRADATLPVRDELALALKLPRYQWQAPIFRSMRAMIEGRFDECEAALEEARPLVQAADDENAPRCLQMHRTWLLMLADRPRELLAIEPETLRVADGMAIANYFQAMVSAAIRARVGEREVARKILDRIPVGENGVLGAALSMATVANAAIESGHEAHARELVVRLRAHAHRNANFGLFALVCMPSMAATLGRLEAAYGSPDEAERHFAAALARAQAMRASAHEAWVRFWWGEALPDRAKEQLQEAEAIAASLGMESLAARARAAHADAPRASAPPAPVPAEQPLVPKVSAFSFDRTNDGWSVTYGGRTTKLKPLRGYAMIARLIECVGHEIHATALAADEVPNDASTAGDAGEMLDDRARAEYRKRLLALREELEEAQELGQVDRAERIHEEIEALSRELARAVGLGGRARRAGSASERARITVQRRVREAIRKLDEIEPELARHLDWAIKTGTFCIYDPAARPR